MRTSIPLPLFLLTVLTVAIMAPGILYVYLRKQQEKQQELQIPACRLDYNYDLSPTSEQAIDAWIDRIEMQVTKIERSNHV